MSVKENTKKLIDAIVEHRFDEVDRLLNGDVDFSVEVRGDNPIHVATRTGNLDLIKKLKSKKANLKQTNVNGNTAMHYAARDGKIDIVEYLKQNGADLNAINTDGESPLHLAVIMQPMDVIEALVDLGMNPNIQSSTTGQTPLHAAMMYGRIEAMEGLLIKGSKPNVRDKKKQKPEDVGKTTQIRESLRTYGAFMSALESGFIEAKGMRISKDFMKKPQHIHRVNIRLENMDIPPEFSTSFYCRREKSENATVKLPKNDEEQVFSDVFHVRISDVTRDCPVKINLPLYAAPAEKEEMMLRFIDYDDKDRTISTISTVAKVNYCLLETTLIPETTCVCVIFVRPKKEENTVTDAATVIKSEVEANFAMDIPAGAFEGETKLSLSVFDSTSHDVDADPQEPTKEATPETNTDANSQQGALLSNVFQINVQGQQPSKGVKMQVPLSKDMQHIKSADEIAIITGDETKLDDDNALELAKTKPEIINGMIVFEVSHFCIYVAAPVDRVASMSDLHSLQRQISNVKERKKPGVFFAMIKKVTEGLEHSLMIECCGSAPSKSRLNRGASKGFEIQNPDASEAIMMAQGDTFTITVSGNASFENEEDSSRKLTFSPNRVSTQYFTVLLDEDITEETDATADLILHKQLDSGGKKEVTRLKIQLHPPPPPPPTPPATPPPTPPPSPPKPEVKIASSKKPNKKKPKPKEPEPKAEGPKADLAGFGNSQSSPSSEPAYD